MLYTGLRSSVAASTTVNLMLVPLSPSKGVVLTILARHSRPLGAAGGALGRGEAEKGEGSRETHGESARLTVTGQSLAGFYGLGIADDGKLDRASEVEVMG